MKSNYIVLLMIVLFSCELNEGISNYLTDGTWYREDQGTQWAEEITFNSSGVYSIKNTGYMPNRFGEPDLSFPVTVITEGTYEHSEDVITFFDSEIKSGDDNISAEGILSADGMPIAFYYGFDTTEVVSDNPDSVGAIRFNQETLNWKIISLTGNELTVEVTEGVYVTYSKK